MRLALGQIDTTQGDLEVNRARIEAAAAAAAEQGARLLILPELAIPGYSPRDLLYHEDFVAAAEATAERIAASLPEGLALIVGSIARTTPKNARRLLNVALLIERGSVRRVATKRFLPNYDVFDERRHFDAGTTSEPCELDGTKIGVTICEDIWSGSEGDAGAPRYEGDPAAELAAAGAELIVNISASPFSLGKCEGREELVVELARRVERPVALVNLVGGNDDVVFDGSSLIANARGLVLARTESFAEHIVVVDLDAAALDDRERLGDLEQYRRAIVLGIRDYLRKSGFERVLLGLSGGIDSALTAALAVEALGKEKVIGVGMPSRYSADESLGGAEKLAGNLGIEFRVMAIESVFEAALGEIAPQLGGRVEGLTAENLQPRIRGMFLMALANDLGALVLVTGNKSELAMGYNTLYGDTCGALAPIADLLKTEVYALSEHINANRLGPIPVRTIEREPTAELRPGQLDSDSLPEYEVLDPLLELILVERAGIAELEAAGASPELARDLLRRVAINEYKRRQLPPGIKVSRKAFGSGRRMPITGGRLDRIPPSVGGAASKDRPSKGRE